MPRAERDKIRVCATAWLHNPLFVYNASGGPWLCTPLQSFRIERRVWMRIRMKPRMCLSGWMWLRSLP